MPEPDVSVRETRRLEGDAGSNLVEYTLLVALIVIVCLSALTVFGRNTTQKLSCVSSAISNQVGNVTC
jgi:Flp pilus assembly pilin Flp